MHVQVGKSDLSHRVGYINPVQSGLIALFLAKCNGLEPHAAL